MFSKILKMCLCRIVVIVACLSVTLCDDFIPSSCHSDADCAKYTGDSVSWNSTCVQGSCICFDEKLFQVECKLADKKATSKLGGPCPCKIPHSNCDKTSEQCVCNKNYIASQDGLSCIKDRVPLDGTCETDTQCHRYDYFSECRNTTCGCIANYTNFQEKCYSVIGLGGKCQSNNDCSVQVNSSLCWNNECVCPKGFVASPDNTMCLAGSDYGEHCNTTLQCRHKLGVGSMCDMNDRCVCDLLHKNFTLDGETKCMRLKRHGDSCTDHNECFEYDLAGMEQRMECYNGQCVCRRGFAEYDYQCISINAANRWSSVNTLILSTAVWATAWLFSKVH